MPRAPFQPNCSSRVLVEFVRDRLVQIYSYLVPQIDINHRRPALRHPIEGEFFIGVCFPALKVGQPRSFLIRLQDSPHSPAIAVAQSVGDHASMAWNETSHRATFAERNSEKDSSALMPHSP
jgi:hypothetical protein